MVSLIKHYTKEEIKSIFDNMDTQEATYNRWTNFLGTRINKLRERKSIEKSQMADDLFLNMMEMNAWLSGNHDYTISDLVKISHVLNIQLDELFKID